MSTSDPMVGLAIALIGLFLAIFIVLGVVMEHFVVKFW